MTTNTARGAGQAAERAGRSLALLLLAAAARGAPLFSEAGLSLGTVGTDSSAAAVAHLHNPDAIAVAVERIQVVGGPFTVSPGAATLAAGQTLALQVRLQPPHNLHYTGWVVASGDWGACALPLTGDGDYPGTDWDATFNLSGTALKTVLEGLVSGQDPLSYTAARTAMFSSLDNVNGWVECVYTGALVQTNGIPDPDVMNTEHTWPQSYGAEGEAASDLHHLFPCDSWTNSSRGNLPFGEVLVSSSGYPRGGADRGTNAAGIVVFEPRPVHKGDCARAMCYFALRYGNRESFLGQAGQEAVLRAWHQQDPVSPKETTRNAGIEALQHNRNPFIDQPGLLERIASLSGSADPPPPPAQLVLLPDSLELDCGAGSCGAWLWLANPGGTDLAIYGLGSDAPDCVDLGTVPASLAAGGALAVPVTVDGPCAGRATLTLATSAGSGHVALGWIWAPTELAPPLVRIEPVSGGRRLVWEAVPGALRYRVEYAMAMEGPWMTLSTQTARQYLLLGEGWPSPSLFRVVSIS